MSRGSPDDNAPGDTGIVIPLRSFVLGKGRLADVLDADERAALVRTMADRVADAAASFPVAIVSSAREVVAWANDRGFALLDDPGSLDAAAAAGLAWAAASGLARCGIVHADLPRAGTLAAVVSDGAARIAVVVPDHRDDGTPVLALPTDVAFEFSYGAGSAARHITEARRRGLDVRVVRDAGLAFDVDVPADLAALRAAERPAAR